MTTYRTSDARHDRRYDEAALEEPDKSLGDLVGDLTDELSALLRNHVQLAKVELTEEAKTAGRASAMLAVAGVAALLALAILSSALAWALAETMAPGWAFLIVGLVWAVAAAALAMAGRQRLQRLERPLPETRHEIKEDQRWLTTQTG
jgi:uncharacterized membrane protein YqjE